MKFSFRARSKGSVPEFILGFQWVLETAAGHWGGNCTRAPEWESSHYFVPVRAQLWNEGNAPEPLCSFSELKALKALVLRLCWVAQSCPDSLCPTLWDPHGLQPTRVVHQILQARILEWVVMPSSRGSSQPRDQTQVSPSLQADSLPAEPPGKPKNTGVGSLCRLQGIFPTQGSNPGFSLIAGGFFTSWATREAHLRQYVVKGF